MHAYKDEDENRGDQYNNVKMNAKSSKQLRNFNKKEKRDK